MSKQDILTHDDVTNAMRIGRSFEEFEAAFNAHIEEHGESSLNIPNGLGHTMLASARLKENQPAIEFLLEKGAKEVSEEAFKAIIEARPSQVKPADFAGTEAYIHRLSCYDERSSHY